MLQLQSKRLIIRNLQKDDLEYFYAYRKESEVARYQGFNPFTYQEAIDFIEPQINNQFGNQKDWQQYGIVLKKEQVLIGDCALKLFDPIHKSVEMGCTISPGYQSRGYAKEALLCLMKFLFEDFNVHRVIAITDVENHASIRLLESIGLRKEAHFIQNLWFKGRWSSEYHYGLLRNEWMTKFKTK